MGYCKASEFAEEIGIMTRGIKGEELSAGVIAAMKVVADACGHIEVAAGPESVLVIWALEDHHSGYDYDMFWDAP